MKDITNREICKYLDKQLKEYFNAKYHKLTMMKSLEFIEMLKEKHKQEELILIKAILEMEVERGKLFGPTQTIYNALFTIVVGVFISMFTFFSSFSTNAIFNFFKDAQQSDVDEKMKILKIVFNQVFNSGGLIYYLLIFLLVFAAFAMARYKKSFEKRYFYQQIISQCIDKKQNKHIPHSRRYLRYR
jgi:hypothetical protein